MRRLPYAARDMRGPTGSERTLVGYTTYTCPVAHECGGCEWLAVPYPIQLKRKQEEMERLFKTVTSTYACEVEPIRGMDDPRGYRHKASTPLAPGKRHAVRCGFYARGTHEIVRCPACLVEAAGARELLNKAAYAAEKLRIPAYDEDRQSGVLRYAVARLGYRTDEVMLTLVTNGAVLPKREALLERLQSIEVAGRDGTDAADAGKPRRITTIAQNVNEKRTNAVLGGRTEIAWGAPRMTDKLLGCTFEISPTAFYQTNPAQTEVLYRLAAEGAALEDGARLLDAYCGSGTIGIAAAAAAREQGKRIHVTGVERNAAGVADARRNAKLNGLDGQARFVAEDATRFMRRAAEKRERYDVLVLDPPRAGATAAFLESARSLAPERIVYVSCNPVTQVRDLEVLIAGGYAVERIAPVDMFPHTKHVEVVAARRRKR